MDRTDGWDGIVYLFYGDDLHPVVTAIQAPYQFLDSTPKKIMLHTAHMPSHFDDRWSAVNDGEFVNLLLKIPEASLVGGSEISLSDIHVLCIEHATL